MSKSKGRKKDKRDENPWIPPITGMPFDTEGPSADYLVDTSEIYDQVVYQHVHALKEEWNIVNESDALPYIPKRKEHVNVTLGMEEKTTVELPLFGTIPLGDHLKYKKGYIINSGSSVWGLDFVPKLASVESDPLTQYIAIGGYRESVHEHIFMEALQPTGTYKNCIQIWKLKTSAHGEDTPLLDLCLLHDYGAMYDIRWCPYGTYEENDNEDDSNKLPKLGILSFSCGDRTIRTIVVPHPNAVRKHMTPTDDSPPKTVYMKIKLSRCTFAIKNMTFMSLTWGGHKKLASGCNLGNVIVWDMQNALLDNQTKDAKQSSRFMQISLLVLDASVRCLSWNGIKDPDMLTVGGFDGNLVLLDTNDPAVSINILRSRNMMMSCAWAGHSMPLLYVDGEGGTRACTFQKDCFPISYKYGDSPGFSWAMAVSEHHGQFAFVTSLGWLRTSNVYQFKSRNLLVNQVCTYKLDYVETKNSYRYIDGIGLQTLDAIKTLPTFQQYGPTYMALQKVAWNPNKRTSAFIASGGTAGLCRIEFEGRGSKWE